nr:DUF4249 domain-containing protein [uncultured Marinifilum sp.]
MSLIKLPIKIHKLLLILMVLSFSACALNNDADIEFPDAEKKLMMECYLTPGKNFELRLMESNSFEEDLVLQLAWNADVRISSDDSEIKLLNILNSNRNTNYVYNYGISKLVPDNYSGNYSLDIITEQGERVSATTSAVEFIPIKEVHEEGNEVKLSFCIPENTKEKYFSIIAEGEYDEEKKLIIEDFDGSNWTSQDVELSLRGNFQDWQNLKVKLLHITSHYFEFKKSINEAHDANIDPFTVPTEVSSNVEGGYGIFTYFTIDSLVIR